MKKIIIFAVLLIALIFLGVRFLGNEQVEVVESPIVDDSGSAAGGGLSQEMVPVQKVRAAAAAEYGVSEDSIVIISDKEVEWPDACLGLAGDDEMCAQVITPGLEVVVKVSGETVTYRVSRDGNIIRKEK